MTDVGEDTCSSRRPSAPGLSKKNGKHDSRSFPDPLGDDVLKVRSSRQEPGLPAVERQPSSSSTSSSLRKTKKGVRFSVSEGCCPSVSRSWGQHRELAQQRSSAGNAVRGLYSRDAMMSWRSSATAELESRPFWLERNDSFKHPLHKQGLNGTKKEGRRGSAITALLGKNIRAAIAASSENAKLDAKMEQDERVVKKSWGKQQGSKAEELVDFGTVQRSRSINLGALSREDWNEARALRGADNGGGYSRKHRRRATFNDRMAAAASFSEEELKPIASSGGYRRRKKAVIGHHSGEGGDVGAETKPDGCPGKLCNDSFDDESDGEDDEELLDRSIIKCDSVPWIQPSDDVSDFSSDSSAEGYCSSSHAARCDPIFSEGWQRADEALIDEVHGNTRHLEDRLASMHLQSPYWDVHEVIPKFNNFHGQLGAYMTRRGACLRKDLAVFENSDCKKHKENSGIHAGVMDSSSSSFGDATLDNLYFYDDDGPSSPGDSSSDNYDALGAAEDVLDAMNKFMHVYISSSFQPQDENDEEYVAHDSETFTRPSAVSGGIKKKLPDKTLVTVSTIMESLKNPLTPRRHVPYEEVVANSNATKNDGNPSSLLEEFHGGKPNGCEVHGMLPCGGEYWIEEKNNSMDANEPPRKTFFLDFPYNIASDSDSSLGVFLKPNNKFAEQGAAKDNCDSWVVNSGTVTTADGAEDPLTWMNQPKQSLGRLVKSFRYERAMKRFDGDEAQGQDGDVGEITKEEIGEITEDGDGVWSERAPEAYELQPMGRPTLSLSNDDSSGGTIVVGMEDRQLADYFNFDIVPESDASTITDGDTQDDYDMSVGQAECSSLFSTSTAQPKSKPSFASQSAKDSTKIPLIKQKSRARRLEQLRLSRRKSGFKN